MATAPKVVPKVVPAAAPAAPAQGSKKKLFIMIAAAVLVLGLGAGGAWLFMGNEHAQAASTQHKTEPPKPPLFLTLDPFTVNLQQENGDQFLQVTLSLQVPSQEQVDQFKFYMPLLRSRLLMLLSSKKASELTSSEGKKRLQEEVIAQANLPFIPQGKPQSASGVFFTSFVIQ